MAHPMDIKTWTKKDRAIWPGLWILKPEVIRDPQWGIRIT